jgi:hypothetical protein
VGEVSREEHGQQTGMPGGPTEDSSQSQEARAAQRRNLEFAGHEPGAGPVSMRWVLMHMIEEYARHNGHADLLREQIDGVVGQ